MFRIGFAVTGAEDAAMDEGADVGTAGFWTLPADEPTISIAPDISKNPLS